MSAIHHDFEVVDMKDIPSPAPAPEPQNNGMGYEDLMKEYKIGEGSSTFEVAGIHYFLYNNGMENRRNEIKMMMMSQDQCRICASRAYKFCPLVGPYGPVFLSNIMRKNMVYFMLLRILSGRMINFHIRLKKMLHR